MMPAAAHSRPDPGEDIRALPSDQEAECTIISTLLVDPENFEKILGMVSADDFYSPRNRRIFQTCKAIHGTKRSVTREAILSHLIQHGGTHGPRDAIHADSLTSEVSLSMNIDADVARMREARRRRELVALGSELTRAGDTGDGDPAAIIATAAALTPSQAAGGWPEPMPLTPDEVSDPYPVNALPGAIGEAVGEVTAFVQCPAALTACAVLAAVSTVAAGLVDVRRADKLSGPAGLYFLALADSGERKSTVDGFFSKQIREWEKGIEEIFKPEIQIWKAADDAWKAERDGILTAIREASKKGRDTDDLKSKLRDIEAQKPEQPKVPKLLVSDDTTTEALTWRLARGWPVGGLLSSEAGIIFGGHSMGRDSIMKNLAALNSLWDGSPLSVDRKTSESYSVRSARLTLGLAVQPETIRQFIDGTNGLARGSGFMARFLVAWPESTQGRRPFHDPPEHWPALGRYHRRLADLLDHPVRFDDADHLSPVVLDLDPGAKSEWIKFHNDIENELAPGGYMETARDVASKAADNVSRLAALFHTFENGPAGTIGADHLKRAADIVTWHLFEARRFLGQMATPEAVSDAQTLEAWLVQRCSSEHLEALPIHQVQKSGPNKLRKKAPLDAALSELEGAYRIRRRKAGHKVEIEINPAIIGGHHGA